MGDRTYKLGSGITSEYGRYVKSLGVPVTGCDLGRLVGLDQVHIVTTDALDGHGEIVSGHTSKIIGNDTAMIRISSGKPIRQ